MVSKVFHDEESNRTTLVDAKFGEDRFSLISASKNGHNFFITQPAQKMDGTVGKSTIFCI